MKGVESSVYDDGFMSGLTVYLSSNIKEGKVCGCRGDDG